MTLIYQPQTANIHLLAITLPPGTSRADRSRFFKRMRQAMWRNQIAMAWSEGLCMHLGSCNGESKREREAIVCWLIDQPIVRCVTLEPPHPLKATLDDQFSIHTMLSEGLDRAQALIARPLLSSLLTGVIVQAVNRRRFAEGA